MGGIFGRGLLGQARDLAIAAHYYIAYGLIAVIALHAGAAIKHQIIDKHGTLKRML